jgi:hypothetical protein
LGAVAVAGLDFPFGVPRKAADALGLDVDACEMPHVWQLTYQMGEAWVRERLPRNANGNVLQLRRVWDDYYPIAMSPLNVRMLSMTLRGMQLLHCLWSMEGSNFRVPPLNRNGRTGTVLLEVMPGAALQAFGLPHRNYKNNKGPNAIINLENRQTIIRKLAEEVGLPNLADYRDRYVFNDDALDSLVAAVVACKWELEDEFRIPENDAELAATRLEGCIYSPEPRIREAL